MNGTLRILASQANGRSTSRHFSVKINLADFRFESNSGCKKLARDLRMSSQEVEGVMPDIHFGRSYTQNGISAIFSISVFSVSLEGLPPRSQLGVRRSLLPVPELKHILLNQDLKKTKEIDPLLHICSTMCYDVTFPFCTT